MENVDSLWRPLKKGKAVSRRLWDSLPRVQYIGWLTVNQRMELESQNSMKIKYVINY